jgi:hypothetical protein
LQSLKHEEILLEFESLKARRERILPSSAGMILTSNQPSPIPSPHHWPAPTMVDSQTSPSEDSAAFPLPPPSLSAATPLSTGQQARPANKSASSQSTTASEHVEPRSKPFVSNQSAQIVVAKYSYEPLQFSPNDHPEIELPLNVGEYYLIYGDADEVIRS